MQLSTENLCNECPPSLRGICCYFMLDLNGYKITLLNHPCKYLNQKTGRCKIYNKRKEINPNCLTLEEMYIVGGLPKDCLYVKNDIDYQKRRDTRLERDKVFEQLEVYQDLNNKPHKEAVLYDTLRDCVCINCKSKDPKEEWDDNFSILFFRYECVHCGHKWNTFKRQIQFTLKLISRSSNLPKNQIQNKKRGEGS